MESVDLARLEVMRLRHVDADPRCVWAVYENQALDSATAGGRIYILIGPGCTHAVPPPHAPDGAHGLGWKYLFRGFVELADGTIEKLPLEEAKKRLEAPVQ